MIFLENKPKLTLMVAVVRSGLAVLSATSLIQASLLIAVSVKFTTLRVAASISYKPKYLSEDFGR